MQRVMEWIKAYYQKDGAFSWILCLGAFLIYAITGGIDNSFGEFILSIMHEFNATEYDAAWIASVHTSSQYFAASLSSALGNRFSFGAILLTGTITTCLAFVASAYCSSIFGLIMTHGLLAGIGLGILFGPLNIICSFYFDSKLALAAGLSGSGSGIGIVLITFLANLIGSAYGWRGCMVLFESMCPLTLLLVLMVMILPDGNENAGETDGHDGENDAEMMMNGMPSSQEVKQL